MKRLLLQEVIIISNIFITAYDYDLLSSTRQCTSQIQEALLILRIKKPNSTKSTTHLEVVDKQIYTNYLNALKTLLRVAEKIYYAKKCHSISENLKKTWFLIIR